MSRSGIVNVRMVITEEKILSNIDKIQKLINPKSKKQIVQLEEDTYFKDLIESVKTYLIEYPKKKNFPVSVYKAAYGLVEYATNQFEENTKKIEELIRQREENIISAGRLKELVEVVESKEKDWKDQVKKAEEEFSEDIIETLTIVGKAKGKTSQNYQDAMKLLNARINNLESNLHIEIDMERIEDRSKALSYIGIEVADALKSIPAPLENTVENTTEQVEEQVQQTVVEEQQQYVNETTFEAKPTLWQRIKNSKFVRTIKMITKIRIVIDNSDALPEGRGENNN
jgi:vacuolar-type H+-ATPase subunit I/STV1